QGHAIILSTHIFSVAEELCDEIAILVDGRIAAQGTVEELMAISETETFENAFFKIYVENHVE
ncbi:MAG: ABC transporter ATP-binding protein, partial [Clostridiales bacterium]|nr:ABC transporter ATP-binding protein [Clostridiales bacterium]